MPTRIWFWISSPTVRKRRLPKWSMSVGFPPEPRRQPGNGHRRLALVQAHQVIRSWATTSSSVSVDDVIGFTDVQAELLVDLGKRPNTSQVVSASP